mmetsp:Transcript_61261/g.187034  ORF Transcript_61261/g.187034 Transcript_61261/m.187034 type:complete len:279 (+) Transcript_61261:168-1004(+)
MCHRRGDAADEGRENHEGEQQHADRVNALRGVHRDHLARRRCKLRQGPMHGGPVSVRKAVLGPENLGDPSDLAVGGSDLVEPVEAAGHEVVDEDDHGDQLADVKACAPHLGMHAPGDVGPDDAELEHPEEPHGANDPRIRFGGAAGLSAALFSAVTLRQHDSVYDDEGQVQGEPRFHVVRRNPAQPHFHDAHVVVPDEKGCDEVQGPEHQRQHPQMPLGRGLVLFEDLQRDVYQVHEKEEEAQNVPQQPAPATGRNDEPAELKLQLAVQQTQAPTGVP